MKKLLTIAITAIFVFGAYAGDGKAKQAKVTNYKDVLSEIEYPLVCKEQGIEGKVLVSINLNAAGEITNHEFLAFPCTDLKEAVEKALPKLQFNPARNDEGQAVKGKVILPVNFKLTI